MERPHGAAVMAGGLGLKGPRGWAFRSIDIEARPGALLAVEGPSGSGRTCLLLALTGRMRLSEGHAEVGGIPLPRGMAAVRRISALGHVPGVSELDPALTVTEHLRERALLRRRFDGSLPGLLRDTWRPRAERAADVQRQIDEAWEASGLPSGELPARGRTPVRELERLEALRLSIALALIGRPQLLAVDDTEFKLSGDDRLAAWQLLRSIADAGTTVVAVSSQAPPDAVVITTRTARASATPSPPTTEASAQARRAALSHDAGNASAGAPRRRAAHQEANSPGSTGSRGSAGSQNSAKPRSGPSSSGKRPATGREVTADAFAETGRA